MQAYHSIPKTSGPNTRNGAVALFVKTPGLSPVKTRLAASLGVAAAESLHLIAAHSAASVIAETCKQFPLQGYYAVAETAALNHPYWQTLPTVWQGDGGLGERMRHMYEQLLQRHPYVLLVGADIPQMTGAQLRECGQWVARTEQRRFAFGPGFDGGFWLFGGNRPLPRAIWTDINYSQSDTGAQFLNAIKSRGDIFYTDILQDADEPADLSKVLASLEQLSEPLPEQQNMIAFLRQLISIEQ